ncbi:MAG: hypothetical protein E7385_05925 [Ruminococcaceae bacterium]|nr:hypothetical protein [Oscillospiraceae bacterium]
MNLFKKKQVGHIIVLLFVTISILCNICYCFAEENDESSIIYSENFESYGDPEAVKSAFQKYWYVEDNNSWGADYGFNLIDNKGSKVLNMSWLGGRLLLGDYISLPESYEIQFQANGGLSTSDSGFIFLRTIRQVHTVTQIYDKAIQGIRDAQPQDSPYIHIFENDGDTSDGFANGVGHAGIFLKLHGNQLVIGVKTTEAVDEVHTKGLGNLRYLATLPDEKNFETDFISIKIIETDKNVSVFADEVLLATVSFSEQRDNIYTKAVIKDALGTEVGSTDTAIIAVKNLIGFSTRGAFMNLDNIVIKSLDGKAIKQNIVPIYDELEAEKVGLIPFQTSEVSAGFRITVNAGDALESIDIRQLSTNGGKKTSLTMSVYKWFYDYDTTIFEDPIYQTVIYDHNDNAPCDITFPTPLDSGHYLVVFDQAGMGEDKDGNVMGFPCLWTSSIPDTEKYGNVVTYVNGIESENGIWAFCVILENGDPDGELWDIDSTPTPDSNVTPTIKPTEPAVTNTPDITVAPTEKVIEPTQEPAVNGNNTGTIVAIVICIVAIVCTVIIIIVIKNKKNKGGK